MLTESSALVRMMFIYVSITILLPLVFLIPALLRTAGLITLDVWRASTGVWMTYVMRIRFHLYGAPLIPHGIIIANHISMTDGGIDNWIHHSEGVYRGMYILSMLLGGLITHLQGWGIRIHRGRTDRHSLVAAIGRKLRTDACARILLYPEGTRRAYYATSAPRLTRETVQIKAGALRSIYEQLPHTPVQVCIALQKDLAFRRWGCVDVPVFRGQPLVPSSFATCTDFIEAVVDGFVEGTSALYSPTCRGWRPCIRNAAEPDACGYQPHSVDTRESTQRAVD